MKIHVPDILAKIPELPENVCDLVDLDKQGVSYVKSRSHPDELHTTHIEPHPSDPGDKSILNVTCTCPASRLCWHIVAHYAVAKELVKPKEKAPPKAKPSSEQEETREADKSTDLAHRAMTLIGQGQKEISGGLQKVVDGMALLARQVVRDEMDG